MLQLIRLPKLSVKRWLGAQPPIGKASTVLQESVNHFLNNWLLNFWSAGQSFRYVRILWKNTLPLVKPPPICWLRRSYQLTEKVRRNFGLHLFFRWGRKSSPRRSSCSSQVLDDGRFWLMVMAHRKLRDWSAHENLIRTLACLLSR